MTWDLLFVDPATEFRIFDALRICQLCNCLFFVYVCYIFLSNGFTMIAVICDVEHLYMWVRFHFISYHCAWISIKIHFEWFNNGRNCLHVHFFFFLSLIIVFSRFHIYYYTHSNALKCFEMPDNMRWIGNGRQSFCLIKTIDKLNELIGH